MARELITIANYSLPYQAELARNALERAGMAVVLSSSETALLSLTSCKLEVTPGDFDRAREVLRELAAERTGPPQPPWTCPKCRAECTDEFDVCFQCGTARDGTEDPDFAAQVDPGHHSPPVEPAWRATPPQFGLRHLMLVMTACSVLFTIGYWLGPASIGGTLLFGGSAVVVTAMIVAVNNLLTHRLPESQRAWATAALIVILTSAVSLYLANLFLPVH